MSNDLKWFKEEITEELTPEQEQDLIQLQRDSGAVQAEIVTENGKKYLKYAIRSIS